MTCPITDLPIAQCGCSQHHRPEATVFTASQLERLAGRPLPEVRYRIRETEWRVPEPQPARCDHRQDDLCGDCSKLVDNLLYDLPELVEQLTITLRKGHKFAPHGFRRGDTSTPDEAPIPWNPSAVRCLADVHEFMRRHPTDRHLQLFELSRLARRAHRIIERPVDREMTLCPKCREEIIVTNRSRAVTCGAKVVEDDPDAPPPEDGQQRAQRIRICDYAASWEQHRKDLLSVNLDAMLTMNELLIVFGQAGEKINRDKINNMIRRHGLPREEIVTGQWRQGEVKTRSLWVYRLGDVMFLMAQIEERKAG